MATHYNFYLPLYNAIRNTLPTTCTLHPTAETQDTTRRTHLSMVGKVMIWRCSGAGHSAGLAISVVRTPEENVSCCNGNWSRRHGGDTLFFNLNSPSSAVELYCTCDVRPVVPVAPARAWTVYSLVKEKLKRSVASHETNILTNLPICWREGLVCPTCPGNLARQNCSTAHGSDGPAHAMTRNMPSQK